MLITFSSRTGPDVLMFGHVANRLLKMMGKAPTSEGIVTVEQIPEVLALLRRAVDTSHSAAAKAQAAAEHTNQTQDQDGDNRRPPISLAQRAHPLIELLERSQRAGKPVLWE